MVKNPILEISKISKVQLQIKALPVGHSFCSLTFQDTKIDQIR
jgi:hypothetical protein